MSKYIKLEDAIHNINIEVTGRKEYTGDMKADLFFALDDLPTIDIVYCKECRWSEPNREGDYDCKCHIPIFRVPEDGWCYLGERIEE